MYQEQVGLNKGKWLKTCEVLEVCEHGKSYWIKDFSTNAIYLHPVDHLKIKECHAVLTNAEARRFEVISTMAEMKSIPKISHSSSETKKLVMFSKEVTGDIQDTCPIHKYLYKCVCVFGLWSKCE